MSEAAITRKIARGAAVNFLGMLSKIIGGPVLFLLLTRLYGKVAIGLFFIAYNLIEILGGLAISGFIDAAIMFASRHIHENHDLDTFRSYMRRIIVATLLISLALALGLFFFAPVLNRFYYSDHPELARILQVMAFILPLEAVSRLSVAIPKAHLIMGLEVITIGVVFPVATASLAILLWYLGFSAFGVGLSFMIGWSLTAIASLFVLSRVVDVRPLLSGRFRRAPTPGLFAFAVAQNLNMALNRFISSMDVLMLAGFGVQPDRIAFYSLGAQIVRNVRQVKLIFSGSYGPVIARHYHEGRILELNSTFARVCGWSLSLGIPALFAVAWFRQDLLQLFDSTFTTRPDFMLILLVNPFFSVATGLTGNAIVMAGFSNWNLLNSLTVGILNFILILILIPRWGLYGAAIATAVAGTVVSIMQILEARLLVGLKLPVQVLSRWMVAGTIVFLWPFFLPAVQAPIVVKLATGLGLMFVYGGIYTVLRRMGPDNKEALHGST